MIDTLFTHSVSSTGAVIDTCNDFYLDSTENVSFLSLSNWNYSARSGLYYSLGAIYSVLSCHGYYTRHELDLFQNLTVPIGLVEQEMPNLIGLTDPCLSA